jgi:hypothetical protein
VLERKLGPARLSDVDHRFCAVQSSEELANKKFLNPIASPVSIPFQFDQGVRTPGWPSRDAYPAGDSVFPPRRLGPDFVLGVEARYRALSPETGPAGWGVRAMPVLVLEIGGFADIRFTRRIS